MPSTSTTLGDLARMQPSATRVFLRHHLDFCCGGKQTLADACTKSGLDAQQILRELDAEASATSDVASWDTRSQADLADHIQAHYHEALRRDVPPLIEAARKVERVHAAKPAVPAGLAALLDDFWTEMQVHMMKEESALFPMLRAGVRGPQVAMPVHIMEQEHDMHADQLSRIRALTGDLQAPPHACATWRALYDGLQKLESDLMEHIHLENNVLFARATNG